MTTKRALVHWMGQPVRLLCFGVRAAGRLVGVGLGIGATPGARDAYAVRTDSTSNDELLEALVAAQVRTTELIATLGRAPAPDASAGLREQVEALRREVELLTLANAPAHARLEDLADAVAEIRESLQGGSFAALELRLGQAVAAQERTNQLLEDALRAGLEEHERAPGG